MLVLDFKISILFFLVQLTKKTTEPSVLLEVYSDQF